jgi:hypothetical protein
MILIFLPYAAEVYFISNQQHFILKPWPISALTQNKNKIGFGKDASTVMHVEQCAPFIHINLLLCSLT